jgi:hypothetical protein
MLTVLGIEKLKPKEKSYKVSDGNGLYILIEPTGGKLGTATQRRRNCRS